MREIKFRAWDKADKVMCHVHTIHFFGEDDLVKVELSPVGEKDTWLRFPAQIEIMQFTGLKDYNGKEIYEGDIVKTGSQKGEVQYDEQQGGYIILFYPNNEKQKSGCAGLASTHPSPIKEVIGNIYEREKL